MNAYVAEWLYIPLHELGADPSIIKRELTIRPKKMRQDGEAPKPIPMYNESIDGYLGVPIDWGLSRYPTLEVEDRTSRGRRVRIPRLPDPHHKLASPNQDKFMEETLEATDNYYALLVKAGTGTGKTVTALWVAAKRARTMLIVVPSEFLLTQWVEEIQDKLGVNPDHIGVVQQDRCDYRKPFVVAIVHSLVSRTYDEDFYSYFGTVVWDEVHRMGAYTFSESVGMFNAETKIAMTATDKRKDGADKVFLWYFGRPQIEAKTETLPCQIKVLTHATDKPLWGGSREALIKCLTFDTGRNEKILKLVAKLYDDGRYTLIIGDSIKHLQNLKNCLALDGVPEEHMGQFTSTYYPVGKNGKGWAEKSKKTDKDYLDKIKKDSDVCIIFATYGSFKEGVDIPRLDAGIDVTPRTEGVQVLGRIRRRYDNKPKPIWFTIKDTKSKRLSSYADARIKDYQTADNVEMLP